MLHGSGLVKKAPWLVSTVSLVLICMNSPRLAELIPVCLSPDSPLLSVSLRLTSSPVSLDLSLT